MIPRVRYISYLLVLNLLLFSGEHILFDLDVIENNQLLLNSYNTNILDTLSFRSVIFNQNHHLPYGTFLFNDLEEIEEPDTVSHLSQFIHKKGDFRYRDLVISMAKINKDNVHYQFLGQSKSFTPIDIYGVTGRGVLQNFLFDFSKDFDDSHLSATVAFHKENPLLPISYNFNSLDQGVYNTRASESVLWGFILKRNIGDNLSISYKNSSQYSSMENNYNITEVSQEETWASFENRNFTVWNIVNSSYSLSGSASLKMDFSSTIMSSFYQNYNAALSLDSLRYRSDVYQSLVGIQVGSFFLGIDAISSSFNSNLTDAAAVMIRPNISFQFLNSRDMKVSLDHRNRCFLNEIPYDSINQNSSFTVPMINLQSSEASIERSKGKFKARVSTAYVSASNLYSSTRPYADYLYSNAYLSYLSKKVSLSLGYSSYDDLYASTDSAYLPALDKYFHYFINYEMPVKNKEFAIVFKVKGRFSILNSAAFNLNSLPMIKVDGVNGSDSIHYIDFSGSLKFNNFMISYHNITNSGNKFGLIDELSDVGGSFSLPTYSLLGSEISIFHYLKVSWVFLD